MKCRFLALLLASGFLAAIAAAAEPPQESKRDPETIKATYLVTGLHCPPCTKTVESSLRRIKGVRSATVDWKTKQARVEFDEAVLPAQQLARLIAETPHMMGGDMQYAGWLALKAPEVKDDATAKRAKEALGELEGVKRVAAYPAQNSVGVLFDAKGEVTSRQLVEALKAAGFEAEPF